MIHQALLRQSVQGRDPILLEFVDTLAPKVLEYCAAIPALGGSGAPRSFPDVEIPDGLRSYTPEELKLFGESNPDQSMATHLLNGVFAAMPLANRLPRNKQLTLDEKRLWILGYLMHDYTKIYGLNVPAGKLDEIRQLVNQLGDRFEFEKFFPAWQDYLDDIVWLAQNIQTRVGANLNERDFNLKTDTRRLFNILRMLGSIVDVLVHVKSPSEVLLPSPERATDSNLREKIKDLFGVEDAPRLTYHKLTEVRGLLSNLINNAMMDALAEQDCEPYLFFPNGAVYLLPPGKQPELETSKISNAVWEKLISLVADSDSFGVRRSGTGLIPSSAITELTGVSGLLNAGKRKSMNIQVTHAASRLYGFYTGKSDNDLLKQFNGDKKRATAEQERLVNEKDMPADTRVDQMGEYLTFLFRAIPSIDKKAPNITSFLLEYLRLGNDITATEANKQKGGTYFGWFYVASKYFKSNPGLDRNDVEEVLSDLTDKVLEWIEKNTEPIKRSTAISLDVRDYIEKQIEFDGRRLLIFGNSVSNEFNRYISSKTDKQPVCSMCSSPYKGVLQETTEIPFVNQQYSNKNPLAHTTVIRGVCPVCRMEMILRRVQYEYFGQDESPIFLWLYPTYFFTPETSSAIKRFSSRFNDISKDPQALLFDLRQKGFTAHSLLNFENFLVEREEQEEILEEENEKRYSENYQTGVFFVPLKPLKPKKRKLTDTDQWAMSVFYGLAIPLLLDVKVVATTSFVPLFNSGADYKETTVLDAPQQFARLVFGKERFRVDELPDYVIKLLHLFDLQLDAFGERFDMHWPQLNDIVSSIKTDPLSVFSYYDRKKRGGEDERKGKGGKGKKKKGGSKGNQTVSISDINRYYQIYLTLGGEANMGVIGKLVDAYAAFYRTRGYNPSAYAIVRPLDELINTTQKSDPKLERDDLALVLSGTLADVMERVWDNNIKDASDPIIFEKNSPRKMDERKMLSRQKQEEFVELFLKELFEGLCKGRRATMQENANRYRSAAKFYYLKNYYYTNISEASNE